MGKIIISVMLYLFGSFAITQSNPAGIELLDLKGNKVHLTGIPSHRATVIILLSPECPLCQSYTLTINNLIKQYSSKGIDFIGIVPTTDFTLQSINDYRVTYKTSITILRDVNNKLVKYLGATITPEVFLLNQAGKTIYSGRIDNWAYELGKKRKVITEHNLRDAIDATIAGKPITVTKTRAVGCFIE